MIFAAAVCSGVRFRAVNSSSLHYWLKHPIHRKLQQNRHFKPLTAEQARGVEKFVFFTGYPRSGHSIVGSYMDAHPNIVLSFGFYLFRHLLKEPSHLLNIDILLQNKTVFFNIIYERSYQYYLESSEINNKGYTLDVPGLWSGRFHGKLKVIGDKSASPTSDGFRLVSSSIFKSQYCRLHEKLGVPLMGIHVVRNPFDMIATHTLYKTFFRTWKSGNVSEWVVEDRWVDKMQWPSEQLNNEILLKRSVEYYLGKAKAVHEMAPLCGMNILEVHNEDFVQNPRRELLRICEFLDVDCPEDYVRVCESKTYRKVSRTRDLVLWPPYLKQQVEESIKNYPFFRGYTFEDDLYNPQ